MTKGRKRIFVVVQQKPDGQTDSITFELLRSATELSVGGGELVCACILGYKVRKLPDTISYYADEVYVIDDVLLSEFHADLSASALEGLCRELGPRTVLMGHNYENREVAPKLACKMKNDLITDCVKIERDSETGCLLCTKPIYGGNAYAIFQLDTEPQIVTLRPKSTESLEKGVSAGQIIPFWHKVSETDALSKSLEIVPEGHVVSLTQADAIVAGGRGVKTAEGIGELQKLVEVLKKYFSKVELGASRALVDEGLVSHSHQVGQTGEIVNPQLYIAVAISGAAQHMAGIAGAKKILAINKDPDASIFGASDYGVVGRYEDIIPALIKQLMELQ
ncbi:MAG: electron transfer flavoprotein subunit alpha/FixB family protein [Deltaproteobacteria bacterium]|nr:electron transfer flavoprotein subunit alpha/FixB family protein [Deltaproteobacteria bacterium]